MQTSRTAHETTCQPRKTSFATRLKHWCARGRIWTGIVILSLILDLALSASVLGAAPTVAAASEPGSTATPTATSAATPLAIATATSIPSPTATLDTTPSTVTAGATSTGTAAPTSASTATVPASSPLSAGTSTATPTVTATASPSPTVAGPFVPIVVKFKASASSADEDAAVRSSGGQTIREIKQIRVRVVDVPLSARARILAAFARQPVVERADAAIKLSKATVPNDPGYAQQWALPKIGWDQAYGTVPISGTTTIAVLDTGVDASHPDLAGRIVAGQSFTGGDASSDPNGHGTELAGIAAAMVNNAAGMAGVAYAGASIMPVQVLQPDGTGYDSDVVAGVTWAADHGANVMLMGFSSPSYSAALADAIAYAQSKGIVVVAATGNDGSPAATYPSGLPNVIGVAATDQNDALVTSSNTGSAAVGAPGVSIYATLSGGGYGMVSGTSASAAEVAGLAALLVASGKNSSQVYSQIVGASDPVSGASFGRIDVAKALGVAVTPVATPTVGATPTPSGSVIYSAASNATISGIVQSISGTPIAGATVSCLSTSTGCNNGVSTTSGTDGSYTLTIQFASTSATVQLTASMAGYCPSEAAVVVTNKGNAKQDFTLTPCTPTSTPTASPTATSTSTSTPTASPTFTPTSSPTATSTPTLTPTTSPTPTSTATSTSTPTPTNVPPAVAVDSPVVVVNEGQTATDTGTYSDPDGDSVTVSASVGSVSQTGTSSGIWSWSLATSDGPQTQTVTISADDGHGATSTTTFTLSVGNVPPAVTPPSNQSAFVDVSTLFDLGSFTDPGADSPWTVDVDWGDGAPHTTFVVTSTGALPKQSHSYTAAGTNTVKVTVTDKDGGSGQATFQVGVVRQDTTLDVSPATGTFGSTTTLSATLRVAGTPLGGKTVSFTLNGTAVCNTSTTPACPTTDIHGVATLSNVSLAGINAGTYPLGVTASFAGDAAYNSSSGSASLTVNKAIATVTLGSLTQTYDGSAKPITVATDPTGLSFSISYTGSNGTTYGPSPAAPTNAGTYDVVVSITDPNYTGSASGTLTVQPRPLTVSATGVNKIYDGTTAATVTLSDDRVPGDTLTVTYGSASFDDPNVGTSKTITVTGVSISGPSASNYTLAKATVTTTASILPRPVEVTADAKTKVYGQPDPPLTYTITNGSLVAGDSFSGSLTRDPGENVGTYAITQGTLALSSNYDLTYIGAFLTITPAHLTVQANNASRAYGEANPTFSGTITGTQFNDNITATYSTTATPTSPVGTYPIVPTLVDPDQKLGNYSVTVIDGTLTILPDSTTTTANPASTSEGAVGVLLTASVSSTHGQPVNEGQVTFSVSQNGTPVGTATTSSITDGSASATLPLDGICPGIYSVVATYDDTATPANFLGSVSSASTLTIVNGAPSLGSITAPASPLPVGTTISASATFTDPGLGSGCETYTATWDWGDGTAQTGSVSGGTVDGSHTYTTAGVFTITLTVADSNGGQRSSQYQYVVIFDANGGYVTGGGWIESPAGACQLTSVCSNAVGKASFGFVSKYQKGASVPTGQTEFQFQAGKLDFHSTSYQWLVISGSKAQYKGTGTINGTGSYGFLLTAVDGQYNGGSDPDRFRIKIWDTTTGNVVYDNQMGASDTATPTTLGGGNIVIHSS